MINRNLLMDNANVGDAAGVLTALRRPYAQDADGVIDAIDQHLVGSHNFQQGRVAEFRHAVVRFYATAVGMMAEAPAGSALGDVIASAEHNPLGGIYARCIEPYLDATLPNE